jgi:hypothetical protein
MRLLLIQLSLSGLLMAFTPGYGESVSGTWRSKEVAGKSLEMREDGAFALVESGVPSDESYFSIEFSLTPGSSYLGYGFGPLPDSLRSEAVVTTYKLSAPLRDWQFAIRGQWVQEASTLQLSISEFEVARVNEATVTEYVAQQVRVVLKDVTLSAAESEELSRLLSQITPMRGGMADLGAEVVLQFSVSGNELQTSGDEGQFSGVWVREVLPTAVESVSWGKFKGVSR